MIQCLSTCCTTWIWLLEIQKSMIPPFVFVFMQTLEEVFCKCSGWRSFIKSCRGERRLLCNSVINQRQHFKDALRIKHNYKKWVSSQMILGDSVIKIRRRGVFTRARDIAYIFTLVKCLMSPGLQITEGQTKRFWFSFFGQKFVLLVQIWELRKRVLRAALLWLFHQKLPTKKIVLQSCN